MTQCEIVELCNYIGGCNGIVERCRYIDMYYLLTNQHEDIASEIVGAAFNESM